MYVLHGRAGDDCPRNLSPLTNLAVTSAKGAAWHGRGMVEGLAGVTPGTVLEPARTLHPRPEPVCAERTETRRTGWLRPA